MATAERNVSEDARKLIEKEGYKIAAIVRQDEHCALFVTEFGRPFTAWWGHDKRGNRKAFIDAGFTANPSPYTFDDPS